MAYRFIRDNHEIFGLRWLLRRFNLSSNAYYNFIKDRKSCYRIRKQAICAEIEKIYHDTEGRLGYRNMKIFLARKGILLSQTTAHK
jgi:putative transposase